MPRRNARIEFCGDRTPPQQQLIELGPLRDTRAGVHENELGAVELNVVAEPVDGEHLHDVGRDHLEHLALTTALSERAELRREVPLEIPAHEGAGPPSPLAVLCRVEERVWDS